MVFVGCWRRCERAPARVERRRGINDPFVPPGPGGTSACPFGSPNGLQGVPQAPRTAVALQIFGFALPYFHQGRRTKRTHVPRRSWPIWPALLTCSHVSPRLVPEILRPTNFGIGRRILALADERLWPWPTNAWPWATSLSPSVSRGGGGGAAFPPPGAPFLLWGRVQLARSSFFQQACGAYPPLGREGQCVQHDSHMRS